MAALVLLGLSGIILVDVVWELTRNRSSHLARRHEEASRLRLLRELGRHEPVRLVLDRCESVTVTPRVHSRGYDNTNRPTRFQP